MAVSAPGRFSTITGWPKSSLIFCATMRVRMSVGPPAGNGTMMRIGRLGKFCASCAAAGDSGSAHKEAITCARIKRMECLRDVAIIAPLARPLGERRPEGDFVCHELRDARGVEVHRQQRGLLEVLAHLRR